MTQAAFYSKNIISKLACPHCKRPLVSTEDGFACAQCQTDYPHIAGQPLDLRLKNPTTYNLSFDLTAELLPAGFVFSPSFENAAPEVNFSGIEVPYHLSAPLLSHFPKARNKGDLMLDLGCGNAIHRAVAEHAGFEYVGVDYREPQATFLGDAHALPFQDESFDFILSIAVLEHLRFPFVAMRETYRVLKRGGKFVGTVAFLEPFHDNSFYHHTHLGAYNSLQYGGFTIKHIAPSKEWSGLLAQASMNLFQAMPEQLTKALVWPLNSCHRLWWKINGRWWATGGDNGLDAIETRRVRDSTGSFAFVAVKD